MATAMRFRWGDRTIEATAWGMLTARRDRPCHACGGVIARGEAFASFEGRDPATGACFFAVCRGCTVGDAGPRGPADGKY